MDRVDLEKKIINVAGKLESCPSGEDLDLGLDLIDKVSSYMEKSCSTGSNDLPKRNIAVLGTTGAGKSTVVSFLFGKGRMLVHHESRFSRVLIAMKGVSIQSGSISSTLLPVCNCITLGEDIVAVWDMPGNRDTRGPFVELIIHLIYHWMRKASLSFVLVSPPLLERPQIAALENIIRSPLISQENAVVIYTKCSEEFDPQSTEDLNIIQSKRAIRPFALREPKRVDPEGHDYSAQYAYQKAEILCALVTLDTSEASFNDSFPDSALLLLNKFREHSIVSAREVLSICFREVFTHNFHGTLSELHDLLHTLNGTEKWSIENVLDILASFDLRDGDCVRSNPSLIRACRRLACVEKLFPHRTHRHLSEWLETDCMSTLENAKIGLAVLITRVKSYRYHGKLSLTSASEGRGKVLVIGAFHLSFSKEKETITKFVKKYGQCVKSQKDIPMVILVGFESLTLDDSITSWSNIALVSPLVTVTSIPRLDLSAIGQAPSVYSENLAKGENGANGIPGLPGGNLIVVCNKLIDDRNELQTTRSRGQQGGNAQNGGDGVRGIDAKYSRVDFKKDVKSAISIGALLTREKLLSQDLPGGIQAMSDTYKDDTSPSRSFFWGATGKRECTLVRVPKDGKPGIRPGTGGQGGAGGQGGQIHILQSSSTWDHECCSGIAGDDGNPGEPIQSSRKSPRFTAQVQQWYYTGGLFRGSDEKPKIEIEETLPPDCMVLKADPIIGCIPDAVPNTMFDVTFVKAQYEFLRTQLEKEFPECDFKDLDIERLQ
ncbi:hypothetical protein PHMEG_0006533 [Phytophthora megakarya]|uniref:G domain-containing protein n=1 Tax=Phytophthora megakarya TaxID=4795 RepID=A0A225WPJ7_9STRA|nr:hypothetical protein PHMEG_0006533 [Phytophthora megakarya]